MPTVQRSRFTSWLKNLAGFKGPFSLNLDGGISPVYDFSAQEPGLDDEQATWALGFNIAAVAAKFSLAQVRVAVQTPQPFVRAVVDGLFLLPVGAAAYGANIGISAYSADVAAALAITNNFLSVRSLAFSVPPLSTGAVTGSAAATGGVSIFGAGLFIQLLVPINTPFLLPSNFLRFVVTPNFAFSVESNIVNQGIQGTIWGRYIGDQL